MREHTPREKALFETRLAAVRAWSQRIETSPVVQQLWLRSHLDARALLALRRQDALYRAVLVEPTGDVPHHIIGDAVWNHFLNDMRVTPTYFYRFATDQWETLFGELMPSDYRKAVIGPAGIVEPEIVRDPEIPGAYRTLDNSKVMEFLGASGCRAIPMAEIRNPYPVLDFPDFDREIRSGARTRLNIDLEDLVIGGKPPLTFTLETNPPGVNMAIVNDELLHILGVGLHRRNPCRRRSCHGCVGGDRRRQRNGHCSARPAIGGKTMGWNPVKEAEKKAKQAVDKIVKPAVKKITDETVGKDGPIWKLRHETWDTIQGLGQRVEGEIKDVGSEVENGIRNAGKEVEDGLTEKLPDLIEDAAEALAKEAAKGAIKEALDNAADVIEMMAPSNFTLVFGIELALVVQGEVTISFTFPNPVAKLTEIRKWADKPPSGRAQIIECIKDFGPESLSAEFKVSGNGLCAEWDGEDKYDRIDAFLEKHGV